MNWLISIIKLVRFWLKLFDYDAVRCGYFGVCPFRSWLIASWICRFICQVRKFSAIISNIFSALSGSAWYAQSFLSRPRITNVRHFLWCHWSLRSVIPSPPLHRPGLFSLPFRMDNFHWSISKFINSFPCSICCWIHSVWFGFCLFCFFSYWYKISIWFFYIFYFVLIFVARLFLMAYSSIFIMAAFKFLSDNSNIDVISASSVDCFSSTSWNFLWHFVE